MHHGVDLGPWDAIQLLWARAWSATPRELMSREATAFELARQCYDDLWPGHPPEQVGREIEQIVKPVRAALAAGRSWRPAHR